MIHCVSPATLAPVCLLCSERDLVCNTPCMVASVVRRHSSHPFPCHFAHTRGLDLGEKDEVKDTVTPKQKDALFPQTTFPLLSLLFLFLFFSFSQLFPFLTLSRCVTTHHLSVIQRPFHPQDMYTPTMNTNQTNTKHNPFRRVSLMFKSSFTTYFFNNESIVYYHSVITMLEASHNTH